MRRALWMVLALGLIACEAEVKKSELIVPPPPTYRGQEFMRGSIGSVAELRNHHDATVSGFGIVVNLAGTGSPDCPPALRSWVMNEMRRGGFGQTRLGLTDRTPTAELASGNIAVVRVEGVIPAGAPKGARFDLQVSALPETSTTSLENGILYSTELKAGGANPNMVDAYVHASAKGHGPVFINPFHTAEEKTEGLDDPRRIGTVMGGGWTLDDAPLQLVVTRPSLSLVQHIADRVNFRLSRQHKDDPTVAVPASESVVNLHVPRKYRDNPQQLLDLVSHLFLDPRPQENLRKAEELAAVLADPKNREHADDVAYAWEAMGKPVLPVLRRHYEHADPAARMAALQAGARLDDPKAVTPLRTIALENRGRLSEQATVLLGEMLVSKATTGLTALLRELLDHDDPLVRVAAFEALAEVRDGSIEFFPFDGKLEMAVVHCEKPLIYATRFGPPRVVIFNDRVGFDTPMHFSMWDNRFMLRTDAADAKLRLFYKRTAESRPAVEEITPTVAYLTGVMAFKPNSISRSPGLDFSYSRIVAVLDQLTREKLVDAPMMVQRDDPAERARRRRIGDVPPERPETTEPTAQSRAVNGR